MELLRLPLLPFLVLFVCLIPHCSGELFSSMAHLQSALYAEREIAIEIRNYVEAEQDRLQKLTKLADEFESHSETALENPDYHLGNPVNAFLFVKHFTIDWDRDIEELISNSSITEIKEKIEGLRQSLPNYEDLHGSVNALLRLQDTYKLDTTDLASGNVGGVESLQLTAAECFEIGRHAYAGSDFYHAIMWMEEAYMKVKEEKMNNNSAAIVLDYLQYSMYKQGNVRRALSLTNEMLEIVPENQRAKNNKEYYEKVLEEDGVTEQKRGEDGEVVNKRQLDPYRSSDEYMTYEALCRGEHTQTYKYQHKLTCQFRHNGHPLLLLSPAREETLYLEPYVVMYHDCISDREINHIKTLAFPKLGRATVHNPKTGKLETAEYRVSKSCWLSDFDSPGIARINKRISAITGLTMDTAEELQIANYGIGGQYEPHFDFARKREPSAFEREVGNRIATFMFYKDENAFKALNTGNRIGTFMFYISDVQAGGATVFPYLGLKIFPKKASAVFWYNLYKNGEGIYDTRHAACPVLVGSKWVSNKWIHERGQEFRRPCGLNESD